MIARFIVFAISMVMTSAALAGVSISGTTPFGNGGLTATTAVSVSVQRGGGRGHASLVPYFSTQGGNSTLINIVNSDSVNGKAIKVRFRSAGNGDSVFNFTLLLAPDANWGLNVSSDGVGGASFATVTDPACTLPANLNAPFSTTRLPLWLDAAQQAEWTREGSVEIITMANIPPYLGAGTSPLFLAVLAGKGPYGAPDPQCGGTPQTTAALEALTRDPTSEAEARGMGLDTPTTGVRATALLINIQDATVSWTTPVTSLLWVDAAGAPARGRLVFSPQTADPAPNADRFTNDPLLRSAAGGGAGRVTPLQLDLPDLSTPYAGPGPVALELPFRQTELLADALKVFELRNQFVRDPDIAAVTDWTVAQPLKRYAVALDSTVATPALTFNRAPAGPSSYYHSENNSIYYTALFDGKACTAWDLFTRSKLGVPGVPYNFGIIGPVPPSMKLCGITSVIVFDEGAVSILKSSVNAVKPRQDDSPPPLPAIPSVDGSAILRTTSKPLPLLGARYLGARGPLVGGKSTKFGYADNHDVAP